MKAVTMEITLATNLTSLNLDQNDIEVLTPDFADLQALEVMSLRKNLIFTLPWEFGGLKKLQHVDLGQNRLKDLPVKLGPVASLAKLLQKHSRSFMHPHSVQE